MRQPSRIAGLAATLLLTNLIGGILEPSWAGATQKDHYPTLTRDTTIVGHQSASMVVTLSEDAVLDVRDASRDSQATTGVILKGRGRFVGIALVRRDWEGGLLSEDFLILGRWGLCQEAGCDPGSDTIYQARGMGEHRRSSPDSEGVLLKAGRYTLHLIADGAPVRISLRLEDAPRERTVLRPDGPNHVDFQAPQEKLEQRIGSSQVNGSGSSFSAGRVGLSLSLMYVRARQTLKDFSGGVCQIKYPTAPPSEISYGPQCYFMTFAGLGTGLYLINRSFDDKSLAWMPLITYHDQGVWVPNIDGRHGIGAWSATTYPLKEFRFMGLTLRVR